MRKPTNAPKYPNLVAEMSRTGIEIQDLCQATGKSKSSIYDYLRGVGNGGFTIDEAFAIQEAYFPGMTLRMISSSYSGQAFRKTSTMFLNVSTIVSTTGLK